MTVEVHGSRLEQPETLVRENPKITRSKDLLDLEVEDRETSLYKTVIVQHNKRHITSAQITLATGQILYDKGVSGYMDLDDLARFELGIQIVRKRAKEWMALAKPV